MIKHIVIFELDEEKASAEKLQEIKLALEALVEKIPALLSIEVGLNMNPAEKQHLVLTAEVSDMEALNNYANHPEHLAAGALIGPLKVARTCVDYKI